MLPTKDLGVVAGAGGFIGGHLVASLRAQGRSRIRAVDIKPFDLRSVYKPAKGIRSRNESSSYLGGLMSPSNHAKDVSARREFGRLFI